MADIGKRIRMRREAVGLTQEGLAEKLGYKNKTSITKIENGTNDIPQSKVVEIAKALDTTAAYLMGWDWDVVNMDLTDMESNVISAYREKPEKQHVINQYLGIWDNAESNSEDRSKLDDMELLEKYHSLDTYGKTMVDMVIANEYARSKDQNAASHLMPVAAHNDATQNKEEQALMQEDLDEL